MGSQFGRWTSVAVGVACAMWCALIISGAVLQTVPLLYRTMFGIITLLYGIYRMVLGLTRRTE